MRPVGIVATVVAVLAGAAPAPQMRQTGAAASPTATGGCDGPAAGA
jgi:hypothetical protein